MKKFNTKFYIDGEYFGFAECTIQGAKDYVSTDKRITSCEGFAEDEWFTYSVEKGWEHFYEVDTNDGEIPEDAWEDDTDDGYDIFEGLYADEVSYNPYTGSYDMDL